MKRYEEKDGMKLTGKCSCGCFVVFEQTPTAVLLAEPDDSALSIEKRFDAWQEEHRNCWKRKGWPLWATILIASVLGSLAARFLS